MNKIAYGSKVDSMSVVYLYIFGVWHMLASSVSGVWHAGACGAYLASGV